MELRFRFAVAPKAILGLLLLLLSFNQVAAQIQVNVDDLDPLKECKRRDVSLAESDNKVYIYGGQSWVNNGTSKDFAVTNHYLRIVDFTSPRDLSDPAILTAKEMPSEVAIFRTGAFWSDSKKVYVVGGEIDSQPYLTRQGEFVETQYRDYSAGTVYVYDIESDNWSPEDAVQPDSGSSARGAFCCGSFGYNSQQRKAYYYSGSNYAGSRTLDPSSQAVEVAISQSDTVGNRNLLTFNAPELRWSNQTIDNGTDSSWLKSGQFVYLPGTESSSGGLAILLGGQRLNPENNMESMRAVRVFDSATGTLYSQATTAEGDRFPTSRMGFCAVAASAPDNSSHNIYIYGGESPDSSNADAFSDLWILTVPSFRWISVNVKSEPRKSHACTRVAERYMLTYGGPAGGWGYTGNDDECDDQNYGLRLFDLSNLNWTTRYEGPASENNAYKIPSIVYKAIGGDESGSATQTAPTAGFNTPALEALFKESSAASPTRSSTSSPTGPAEEGDGPSRKTNVGAIAGGVVGGVVVLGALVFGVVFLMRRRKRNQAYGPAATSSPVPHELDKITYGHVGALPQEIDGQPNYPPELPGDATARERKVYEMYGGEMQPPQRQTSSDALNK